MFGLSGVWPGAGGGDVRVWDGAILHPQGVTTLSCKGKIEGSEIKEREKRERGGAGGGNIETWAILLFSSPGGN